MQFELLLILQIVFAHWVSDFVLQSGWMAVNKSKNWWALTLHVLTYTASIGLLLIASGCMLMAYSGYTEYGNGATPNSVIFVMAPAAFVLWVVINGILHFITDAITSRITSKLWTKGDMHNFFVVVGFDQLVHYTCLFSTLAVLWAYKI